MTYSVNGHSRQDTGEKQHCRKFYTNFISFFIESINFSLVLVYLRYTKSCIIHSICESTSKLLLIEQAPISAQAPNSAQFAGNQKVHYWGRRLYLEGTVGVGHVRGLI